MDKVYFLEIYETEHDKQRIGSDNDGGYVIATGNDLSYQLLISCGISDDIQFEEHFLDKYDVSCIAFDGTISNLPVQNNKIQFIRKNIANKESDNTTTLHNIINSYDNIFLKMDIETNEYQER